MTGRLPFDPKRMAASQAVPASPPAAAKDAPQAAQHQQSSQGTAISVSQLAQRITAALEAGIDGVVRVVGEVSGTRERTHWYFDIKDESSVISCALFRGAAKKSKSLPADGTRVIVTGKIEFYAPAGKVTLIASDIEPVGRGAWEVQLRELLAQAKAHGWLDPERKRPLPTFPRAIAIITSKSAAALQDVLVTMQKRCPAVGAIVIDSRVQGQQAVGDVVAAFAQAAELAKQGRIDAVIVTRGGGSVEDLWCFHDLAIARAIVQCPVPVVAAIGHETDTSIAELVADERCATPTQAAMRLTPDRVALQRELHSMQRQLLVALKRNVERRVARLAHARAQRVVVQPASLLVPYRSQLEQQQLRAVKIGAKLVRSLELRWNAASQRMHKQEPSQRLRREQDRIDAMRARMQQAMQQRMRELAARLEASRRQFHAIGPTKVLERGYSVTTLPDGTIVRDPSQAPPGTKLLTRVALGDLASTVEGAQVAPWNPKRSPSKANRGKSQAPGGPGLFG